MISPFEVYLVLQLDSLRGFFIGLTFVFGFVAFLGCVFFPLIRIEFPESIGWVSKRLKLVFVALVLSAVFNAFLPSSATAAAMIVLPALSSPEVLQPLGEEAGEIYELAKDALRSVVEKPEDGE